MNDSEKMEFLARNYSGDELAAFMSRMYGYSIIHYMEMLVKQHPFLAVIAAPTIAQLRARIDTLPEIDPLIEKAVKYYFEQMTAAIEFLKTTGMTESWEDMVRRIENEEG